jgi:hypothetical protein
MSRRTRESRRLYDPLSVNPTAGYAASCRATLLGRLAHGHPEMTLEEIYERPGSFNGPSSGRGGMKKVAYYKGCPASLGAKEPTTRQAPRPRSGWSHRAESVTRRGAGDIHEAEPDYLHLNARILVRRGEGSRHAPHRLQRLHAEPPPGELHPHG